MRALRLMIISGIFLLAIPAAAQTPDGMTPANEGVCDVLVDATPGLYGLCVAFCEAQDCVPDNSLDDPFANCKPSSSKLLELYEKRMNPGDPYMPCYQQEPPELCPCFTAEELDVANTPYRICQDPAWIWPSCSYYQIGIWSDGFRASVSSTVDSPDEFICNFWDASNGINRGFSINGEQFLSCAAMIEDRIDTFGCNNRISRDQAGCCALPGATCSN